LAADIVGRVQGAAASALAGWLDSYTDRPFVVAVSGGADSTCLIDVLAAVVPDAPNRLVVGHVDHQLRPDSAADAEHVRALAAGYGLRCHILTVDVPALARVEGRGIEEAARLGRYRALRDLSPEVSGGAPNTVFTGHTRDDSIETVLLHLLRGSGPAGLGGIAATELLSPEALGEAFGGIGQLSLRLARPLLGLGRADTVTYCLARGLSWCEDESNTDPQFLRNRVRSHLLPVLRTYNPAIDDALDRLAAIVRDEDGLLDESARDQRDQLGGWEQGRVALDLGAWRRVHIALQRRIVRRFAAEAGYTEISFTAVERALAVGHHDGPPRAELGGGLVVTRRAGTLTFDRTAAKGHDDRA
jgi:tRNA(Ile)-lysidine synthase